MLRLRVNEILKQQHKSRYWLNNQMGMTYTNLRRIIDNETTSIRYDTLENLCRVLQILLERYAYSEIGGTFILI